MYFWNIGYKSTEIQTLELYNLFIAVLKKKYRIFHAYPLVGPPTDTTCMGNEALPLPRRLPAHWPTTVPAISSLPPCEGMAWRPTWEEWNEQRNFNNSEETASLND